MARRTKRNEGDVMADLRKIKIDDKVIEVDPNLTLIQACEQAGVEVPRFCYHERLSIAGNCRMCLVEVVGGPPKPAASCAMQVKDLRPGPDGAPSEVRTNSPMVRKAQTRGRDGVPADQPPAGLPDLRSGRRVRPAGSGHGLRRRFQPLSRTQARQHRPESGAAGRNPHDALHFLHPLRALHHRGGGHHPDGPDRPRRGQRDHQLSGPDAELEPAGQYHRPVPGGRAGLEALCLHRPPVERPRPKPST